MKFIHGAFTGVIVNLLSCTIITLLMKFFAIGDQDLLVWLVSISLPWFVFGYGLMSIRLDTGSFSVRSFRFEVIIFSFILLLFSNTIGVLLVELLKRDVTSISIIDYLISGVLYSLGCLPIFAVVNYFVLKKYTALIH